MTILSKEFMESFKKELSKIKAEGSYDFEVIVSTDSEDRVGDRIMQEGIEKENYMKNPIVLIDHNYSVEAIIGKTTELIVEDKEGGGKQLKARGIFSKTNPRAKVIKEMYDEGMINTVSIGFIPYEYNNGSEILKSEMLEFSFVAVPCNPEALSIRSKSLISKAQDIGMIKLIEDEKGERNEYEEVMSEEEPIELEEEQEISMYEERFNVIESKLDRILEILSDDNEESKRLKLIEDEKNTREINILSSQLLRRFKELRK